MPLIPVIESKYDLFFSLHIRYTPPHEWTLATSPNGSRSVIDLCSACVLSYYLRLLHILAKPFYPKIYLTTPACRHGAFEAFYYSLSLPHYEYLTDTAVLS